ncbi:hypothetical protein ACWEJ6_12740 [Nonomuraea sp. NPDC004702]
MARLLLRLLPPAHRHTMGQILQTMAYLRESEFSGATRQNNIRFNGEYSDIKDVLSFRSLLIVCPLIKVRTSFMLDAGVSPLSHYRSAVGGYKKNSSGTRATATPFTSSI